jgi:predicted NAD/FAD-binding protein
VNGFLYPLLLSFWDVELEDFKTFAAYSVLYYAVMNYRRDVQPPVYSQIIGGMRAYIDALEQALSHTQVRRGARVTQVTYAEGRYLVEDASGCRYSFEHLILATNARQAFSLLAEVPPAQAVREQLGRFQYFETTIAIHGDRRLMPPKDTEWSVVNVRWNGLHSELSIWRGDRRAPVFKSWVTFEAALPDPLYCLQHYDHVKVTLDYYDAQAKLKTLQGHYNLWLTGQYTYDTDSHESAIRSAVAVAQRLALGSARLKSLQSR